MSFELIQSSIDNLKLFMNHAQSKNKFSFLSKLPEESEFLDLVAKILPDGRIQKGCIDIFVFMFIEKFVEKKQKLKAEKNKIQFDGNLFSADQFYESIKLMIFFSIILFRPKISNKTDHKNLSKILTEDSYIGKLIQTNIQSKIKRNSTIHDYMAKTDSPSPVQDHAERIEEKILIQPSADKTPALYEAFNRSINPDLVIINEHGNLDSQEDGAHSENPSGVSHKLTRRLDDVENDNLNSFCSILVSEKECEINPSGSPKKSDKVTFPTNPKDTSVTDMSLGGQDSPLPNTNKTISILNPRINLKEIPDDALSGVSLFLNQKFSIVANAFANLKHESVPGNKEKFELKLSESKEMNRSDKTIENFICSIFHDPTSKSWLNKLKYDNDGFIIHRPDGEKIDMNFTLDTQIMNLFFEFFSGSFKTKKEMKRKFSKQKAYIITIIKNTIEKKGYHGSKPPS